MICHAPFTCLSVNQCNVCSDKVEIPEIMKAVRIMYNVMSDNVYLSLAIRVDQVEEMIPVHYRITGVPLQRVVSQ